MRSAWILVLGLLCSMGTAATTETTTTVYVVRHAEKAKGGADPSLTSKGRSQALALRHIFKSTPLSAIYVTRFKRTQQTAAPTAKARGLRANITNQSPQEVAHGVLANHRGQHVLVVGHSHTIPEILRTLGVASPPKIHSRDYGDLYVLKIRKDQTVMRVMKF